VARGGERSAQRVVFEERFAQANEGVSHVACQTEIEFENGELA